MLLWIEVPRRQAGLFAELSRYALTSTLAVAVLFPLAILLLLQWIVTGPLSRLTAHAVTIGQADDTTMRLNLQRRDEIGVLGDEFDRMLEQLARSRQQVVHNARLAGMSEVSVGVLHNVGNVLNSVNVSAHSAVKRIRSLKLSDLRTISTELEQHAGDLDAYLADDVRGRHLLGFFAELIDGLEAGAESAGREMRALGEGVEHIAVLMSALSTSDAWNELVEPLDLAEQVNSAIELSLRSLDEVSVEVQREFDELPRVLIDRHKLMQVLVNLMRNALQALETSGVEEKQIHLGLAREGDESVRIEIADNGMGIPPEDLTRVFALGHTTKPDGRGLGLHLAATTVGEMGGSLGAYSEGPGRGATFTLRLPLRATDHPAESRSAPAA